MARSVVLGQIRVVGKAAETALGAPQDVEGVVGMDGRVVLVQARPQVL